MRQYNTAFMCDHLQLYPNLSVFQSKPSKLEPLIQRYKAPTKNWFMGGVTVCIRVSLLTYTTYTFE